MGAPYQVKPKKSELPRKDSVPEKTETERKEDVLEDAKRQAEEIIRKATAETDEMLAQAQEKIALHMQEVEQQAKEEGYRYGEKLAQQHYQDLIREAEEMKQEAEDLYKNTVLSLEGEMVETILEISRKVIGTELSQNREVVVGLIRQSLQGSFPSEEITVSVSPEDYETVMENREQLMEGLQNVREINVKKDSSLKKGGCIVDTGFGSVDAGIETQLKAVEDTFRELLGEQSGDNAAACAESNGES